MNKNNLFVVELEKFITAINAGIKVENIELEPIFFRVIENLEKLDKNFSVTNGYNLYHHIKVPNGNIREEGILFSEQLTEAIKNS